MSKITYLFLPAYWDEAWVYIPAIRSMSEGWPSLFPGVIDSELSRGHPLLYHFIGGWFYKIFGGQLLGLRIFSLSISVALLSLTYYSSKKIINSSAAIYAVLSLALYDVFFVQSVFVLPEVLFAFLCLLSIYNYARKNWYLLSMSLSLLLLTKESGLVMIIAIVIASVIDQIKQQKIEARLFPSLLIPVLVFALFLFLNHQTHGWYFYPMHTDFVEINFHNIHKFRKLTVNLFSDRAMWPLSIFLITSVLLFASSLKKNRKLLAYCLTGLFIFLFSLKNFPQEHWIVLLLLSIFFLGLLFGYLKWFENHKSKQSRFLVLASIFGFGFILFSAFNFYVLRYLLAVIPLFCIAVGLAIDYLIKSFPKIKFLLIAFLILSRVISLSLQEEAGDSTLGYTNDIEVYKKIGHYIEKNGLLHAKFRSGFTFRSQFQDAFLGYIDPPLHFPKEEFGFDYYIYDNFAIEQIKERDALINYLDMDLVFEIKIKNRAAAIYKNNGPK